MSVDFYTAEPKGNWYTALHQCKILVGCNECSKHYVNLSNSNAVDLLEWLSVKNGGGDDIFGVIAAKELAVKCRRRLWDEPRNHDPRISPEEECRRMGVVSSDRAIFSGRESGYLRSRTKQLLTLAELAGEQFICWS